jgi:AcrR family transcriptional regulator
MNDRRAYCSPLREERAAATRERVLAAAQELFADATREFTVQRVAAMAGVSVQTVLRAFNSRNGLIYAAIGTFRATQGPTELEHVEIEPFASLADAVRSLFEDYESIGDRVVRMLAEEHRVEGFAEVAAVGREMHRRWVVSAFGPRLPARKGRGRDEVVTALVAATDVSVWKLLRRDLHLDRAAAERIVLRLVQGALDGTKGD